MSQPLSVVLMPAGADRALHALLDISRHELAHRVVITDGNGTSLLVEAGASTPIDVIQFLARQQPSLLRLVSVGYASDSGFQAPIAPEALRAELSARALQANLPIVAISIAVPHESVKVPSGYFSEMWHANVIVAPEDTAGSSAMIAVPLSLDKAEFVALAFALLAGGVWSWMTEGVFDTAQLPTDAGQVYARLARGITRVVDAGDLPARIIAWALNSGGAWPVPPDCVPHGSPTALIDVIAPRLASSLRFAYHPLPEVERSRPKEMTLLGALRYFFAEVVSSIRAMPGKAWRSLKSRVLTKVEQLVQDKTFGEDSAVVVRIDGAARSVADLVGTTRRVGQLAELPSIEVPSVLPSPDSWRTLMAVLCSLIDGGDITTTLPDSDRSWQGRRAVVSDRTIVVPYVEVGASTGFTLSASDLSLIGLVPDGDESAMVGGVDVATARLVQRHLDALPAFEVSKPEADSSGDTTVPSADDNSAPNDLTARFSRWKGNRERSLLWRLATHLADGIELALKDVVSAEQKLSQLRNDLEQYQKDEQTLLRRRRRGVLFGLLWMTAVIAAAVLGWMRWSLLGAAVGFLVLILSLVALAWRYVKIAIEEVRLKHRLGELEARPAWLLRFRQQAVSEASRLASINDQLTEWVDVYSHLIHHPWGEFGVGESSEPWRTTTQVLGFTCGSPSIDNERVQGEVTRLRRQVCRAGWLSAVYSDLTTAWRERYAVVAAVDPGEESTPEADVSDARDPLTEVLATGEAVYRPRQQLARDVVDGRFNSRLLASKVSTLRATIARSDADELVRLVECDIEGLSGLEPERFLATLVDQSPLPQLPQRFVTANILQIPKVQQSVYAVSDVLGYDAPSDGVDRRRVPIGSVADRFVLAAFRLDMTDTMPIDSFSPIVDIGGSDGGGVDANVDPGGIG